ncbi:unnamed protein product [Caenorhabditis nigoni]
MPMSRADLLVVYGLDGDKLGPGCRKFYQTEYDKCEKDEACRAYRGEYKVCCVENDYCNSYSTNWFFWLMLFLAIFIVMIGIGVLVFIFYFRRKRKAGRGDDELVEEPSDTI